MDEDIVSLITTRLIEGGWSSVYSFVDSHLTEEDIRKYLKSEEIDINYDLESKKYRIIDSIDGEEILDKKGLVITHNHSNINDCNLILDRFIQFCKENHYPPGTVS